MEEITIELTEQEFLSLAIMAHEKDITFNNLCNQILKEQIDKIEKRK